MPPRSTPEHFWSMVDMSGGPDACWPFLGYINPETGYGDIQFQGRHHAAHRLSYILTYGEPPKDRPWILHHCDNRPCCNPNPVGHLFAGNATDNNRDMVSKHRHGSQVKPATRPLGERHGSHRLTNGDVSAIRLQGAAGRSSTKIAADFGVSNVTILSVIQRKTWKHISP